jgi:hypothetical protein
MTDAINHRADAAAPPLVLGPAFAQDGTIAPWVRDAMDRATEAGIDARRVALALGIPLRALDGPGAPPGRGA